MPNLILAGTRRHRRRSRAFLCALGAAVVFGTLAARASDPREASIAASVGSTRIGTGVTSLRARRDAGVVRQHYDFSCGAAALATLLTYALDDSVDEAWMLHSLLAPLAEGELIALQRKGLSLLELQNLANLRGHQAQAFRISVDQLPKLSRPVIVFIKPGGHHHFAVLKGVRGDRVYLADPSLGNVRMPLYRFREMWADESGRGVIFAVEPRDGRWPESYALMVEAPPAPAIEWASVERLSTQAIPLPSTLPNR